MASTSGYRCSFCKITVKTEKGWLNHLLSPDHQAEAREDLHSWDWLTKDRVVVAFGKFSVATETVLGAFVKQDGRSNLSGFVWNEKCPHVGLLVFETREKVDGIFKGLVDGCEMRIGNYQLLQLRKAADYFDLEWEELIAQDFRKELKMKFKTEIKTEKMPTPKHVKMETFSSDESISDSDSDEAPVNKITIKVEPVESAPSRLCSQFDVIRRQVEMGDAAYSKAIFLMEKCQQILKTKYTDCQLFMFRHWYLKLRAQQGNELPFYVDAEGILGGIIGGEVGTRKISNGVLANEFVSSESQQILTGIKSIGENDRRAASFGFGNDSALHFEDVATKAIFSLVTDPLFAAEAQTCRLLNYLLDFDPRARPFLTLIFYWAEQNRAKIQGPSRIEMQNELSHAFAPKPAGLEWMVISFLCHKRILPTPRQIVERRNTPRVWYIVGELRIDIGFCMDDKFAEEWRAANAVNCPVMDSDQFVLNLVELSKEFFEFYGQLRSTSQHWGLNTRDGELVKKEDLLGNTEIGTRLTKKELVRLRNSRRTLTPSHVRLNGLGKRRFTILHPLIIEWTIPCDEDNFFARICVEMLASANIIDIGLPFLDVYGSDSDEDQNDMCSLQELFGKVTLDEARPFM